jgi:hypothetical protein
MIRHKISRDRDDRDTHVLYVVFRELRSGMSVGFLVLILLATQIISNLTSVKCPRYSNVDVLLYVYYESRTSKTEPRPT